MNYNNFRYIHYITVAAIYSSQITVIARILSYKTASITVIEEEEVVELELLLE